MSFYHDLIIIISIENLNLNSNINEPSLAESLIQNGICISLQLLQCLSTQ